MRIFAFVPMIKLGKRTRSKSGILIKLVIISICAVLCAGCSGAKAGTPVTADSLRVNYMEMSGCSMNAVISCEQDGILWQAELSCEYIPGGMSSIEVLSPESIAGVRAVLDDETWSLNYESTVLNAGMLSRETISPAAALPRLMNALREGWILEENAEVYQEIPCTRITMDQDGTRADKIYSTLWLRQDSGIPLKGEISVDGTAILTAEFTDFVFYHANSGQNQNADSTNP